jgi:hypothetical protein
MSHQPGTYLGGIRTVEDLRQRCRIDHEGCWRWSLAVVQGNPKVHFVTPDTGVRVAMRGRRAALYLQRGRDIGKGMFAFARPECHGANCVNPDHARAGSKKAHGRHLKATGRATSAVKSAAAREVAKRRRKLTAAQVIEIRQSAESIAKMAERFGVSQFCVWSVRAGKSWKDTPAVTSVFDLGLMQRAA